MSGPLRAGVVGVGHLGALHAAKYTATDGVRLVGVYDIDHERAVEVAARTGCAAFANLEELLGQVDCASIAASTAAHHQAASAAIARGVHVLVEKPLAASLLDATSLVEAAARGGVLLQVGHLERFNPAFADLPSIVGHPRFIECHRLAPFAGRGTDTDVIFDVMIHDLDLIAFVVGRPLVGVEAIGVPVLSDHADIANARLRFEGGCIANVTASRVSLKRERRLRIFQEDAYVAVDFDARSLRIVRRRAGAGPIDLSSPMDAIEVEERTFADDADPLRDEIAAFAAAVGRVKGGGDAGHEAALARRQGQREQKQKEQRPREQGQVQISARVGGESQVSLGNLYQTLGAVSGREALVALEIAERVRAAVASEAAGGGSLDAAAAGNVP